MARSAIRGVLSRHAAADRGIRNSCWDFARACDGDGSPARTVPRRHRGKRVPCVDGRRWLHSRCRPRGHLAAGARRKPGRSQPVLHRRHLEHRRGDAARRGNGPAALRAGRSRDAGRRRLRRRRHTRRRWRRRLRRCASAAAAERPGDHAGRPIRVRHQPGFGQRVRPAAQPHDGRRSRQSRTTPSRRPYTRIALPALRRRRRTAASRSLRRAGSAIPRASSWSPSPAGENIYVTAALAGAQAIAVLQRSATTGRSRPSPTIRRRWGNTRVARPRARAIPAAPSTSWPFPMRWPSRQMEARDMLARNANASHVFSLVRNSTTGVLSTPSNALSCVQDVDQASITPGCLRIDTLESPVAMALARDGKAIYVALADGEIRAGRRRRRRHSPAHADGVRRCRRHRGVCHADRVAARRNARLPARGRAQRAD